MKAFTSSRAF